MSITAVADPAALTRSDRCDRCGAQAFVRAILPSGGELLFCGHHARAVEDALVKRIPREMLRPAHHWLILHGRYVCKARRPECWRCIVRDLCAYTPKTPAPAGVDVVPQA